jgi:hypothetical protein
MLKNIKVNYRDLLPDYAAFEKQLLHIVGTVVPFENVSDAGQFYTSTEYLERIKVKDTIVGEYTNLQEFDINSTLPIIRHLMELYPGHSIVPTGHFHYPVTGYMSWHTNSNLPGKRVYVTVVDKVGHSGFKYLSNNQVLDCVDTTQITIREFEPSDINLFWHSVYSNCNRYSFGFRVIDLR